MRKSRLLVLAHLLVLASCSADESVPMPGLGWEYIGGDCSRLEVPMGWIIRGRGTNAIGVTFVADPEKLWKK